ncbi:trypsin-like peptidase domain-containing protein [Paenibacillus thermotolerans]|uniref:trypsin-like peptidase domain-containing protein n=1 Tax=Paenibacillus thermotolerans TaxID=3027807 RepID=UPI002367E37F|nr:MULTISPECIES: trypsin-like peptidase domain-containing protein [unclassified Paenibacillus]
MKKVIAIVLASLLFAGVASASSLWGTYKGNNIIRLTVDGAPVKVSDVPVISYQGRTMVPIYLLKEAGINYTWDQKNQTVDVVKQIPQPQETAKPLDVAQLIKDVERLGGYAIVMGTNDEGTFAALTYEQKRGFDADWSSLVKIFAVLDRLDLINYIVIYEDENEKELGKIWLEDKVLEEYALGKLTEQQLREQAYMEGKIVQKPLSVKEIAKLRDRVGYVETYDEAGKIVSTGSGFMIEDGLFITNFHVMEGAIGLRAKIDGRHYDNEGWYLFENPDSDLFGLVLSTSYNSNGGTTGAKPSKYLKTETELPEIGDKVYAIGSPLGLENTVTDGIVSGIRTIDGIDYIQHTAIIEPGSSGGVLLDEYGNVLGVNTWKAENSDLYFAVPIKYVYEELEMLED